jgi:LacI family transcriptional regulator
LLGVESLLKEKGYHLLFCNSEGDPEKENNLLRGLIESNMVGYIIQPVYSETIHPTLSHIVDNGIPLVMIDRSLPGLQTDIVMSDHYQGGYEIVQYLIRQGYRDIVYLAHEPVQLPSIAERYRGYQASMADAGLAPREQVVVGGPVEMGYLQNQGSPTTEEKSVVDTIAAYLRRKERPEAIIAMNDLVAMLVCEAADKAGLKIPGNLGLVGFDNLDCADTYDLTTMVQQPYEIGCRAADLLLQRIQGYRSHKQQILLPVQLIERGSSRKKPVN